jgi:hypothetical protein
VSLEELKKRFIVEGDVLKARLEPIVDKALKHCLVDKNGQVHITRPKMPAREQVMLVLAARAVASQLEPQISADVSVSEIAKYTGLPENQVRARGRDLIDSRLAQSSSAGVYRALHHKVEDFLDGLSVAAPQRRAKTAS